jgi:hypothetical protein
MRDRCRRLWRAAAPPKSVSAMEPTPCRQLRNEPSGDRPGGFYFSCCLPQRMRRQPAWQPPQKSARGNHRHRACVRAIAWLVSPTRPISTMHTAKTQSVRLPQRNRLLLRPIAYYRHYGPAAWIDPVVLRAITISWNKIVIPVRSCPYYGHPDDRSFPWFTNDFGVLRMRCDTERP